MTPKFLTGLLLGLFLLGPFHLAAQEEVTELAPVRVFGASEEELSQPLAPNKISKEKIESQQITDVNRALKQTPGVYVREEDGVGLRPNIGLRGTNPDRSKKVVLLEDGVLIGPAPYSAPAAYYTPTMDRTESLDIYKGFAATNIGPNSVGGAVNYNSISIPSNRRDEVQVIGGSYSFLNIRGLAGGPTRFGGYLIQSSSSRSAGFKKLDGGGDTGFYKNNLLAKLRFDLPQSEGRAHQLEFRGGWEQETSNETYLGLTRDDFDENPYRRYGSSAPDQMVWEHLRFQLRHDIQLEETTLLSTTVYHHRFMRDWHRFDRFGDNSVSVRDVLNDPTGVNETFYQVLTGAQDSSVLGASGDLIYVNNDRQYVSQGIQTELTKEFKLSDHLRMEPKFFARLHNDKIERNHTSERHEMVGGEVVRTSDPKTTTSLNQDQATAITLATLVNVESGPFVFTPVLRYESVNFEYVNKLDSSKDGNRYDSAWVPGFGVLTKINEHKSLRVSWNKAVTLAGLSPSGEEVKEEADNYELELRSVHPQNLTEASVTLFMMDYRNLTGTCTVSSGCNSTNLDTYFNGGKAKVWGLEAGYLKGYQWRAFYFPIQGQLTLLNANFESDFVSDSPEWGVGDIKKGDPLPYIPQVQYSLSLGAEWRKWRQELTLIYQSKVYDQSAEQGRETIAAYGIVDWALEYNWSKNTKISAKIDNLLDRRYAVAARPFGLRPGKPQSFQIALKHEFE